MGGMIATLYAGAFPERVMKLAVLEGAGPPDNSPDVAPARMRRWIEDVRGVRSRPSRARPAGGHQEALARLAANHSKTDLNLLEDRLKHLVRPAGDALVWRHDWLHKTLSPMPFFASVFSAFAKQVTCPTLWIDGGPDGYHPPDEADRLAAFSNLTRLTMVDAGHMMHWTKPNELASALVSFWRKA
jgi:pimeloyl-ACP methyl ester carboxylesterase